MKQNKSGQKKYKNQNIRGYRGINTGARVEKPVESAKKTQNSGSTRAPVFINTAYVEWSGAWLIYLESNTGTRVQQHGPCRMAACGNLIFLILEPVVVIKGTSDFCLKEIREETIRRDSEVRKTYF